MEPVTSLPTGCGIDHWRDTGNLLFFSFARARDPTTASNKQRNFTMANNRRQLALLFLLLANSAASMCPENRSPLCFCSSDRCSDSPHRGHGTEESCETFCQETCGTDAGSSLSCPMPECLAGDTCRCGCTHKTPYPTGLGFAGQCVAFCDRVCNVKGIAEWSCAKYDGSGITESDETKSGSGGGNGRVLSILALTATAGFLF